MWTKEDAKNYTADCKCAVCKHILDYKELGISLHICIVNDEEIQICTELKIIICRSCFKEYIGNSEDFWEFGKDTSSYYLCYLCQKKIFNKKRYYTIQVSDHGLLININLHRECFENAASKELIFNG